MRFILVYKYGILQTKTERIDVDVCTNTKQLIEYLEKRVNKKSKSFIVRYRRGGIMFRVIEGWQLTKYNIKQGIQLQIELIEDVEVQKQAKNMNINNRYLSSLGINRVEAIEEIKQTEEQNQDSFNIRKYLDEECEKMLKEIQKKNTKGFLSVFQTYPIDLEETTILQIQQKKPLIIDQLGERGWGAIHYAVFYEAVDIFKELLDMDVDINKCTSEGWLPIQLAIDKQSKLMINLLLQANVNLNIVSNQGTALHSAVRLQDEEIVSLILTKQVDTTLKDHRGKTIYESCINERNKQLVRRYQKNKQIYHLYANGNIPISLACIVKGTLLKVKRPFMTLKERFLNVDPFQGSLIRYENVSDYPLKAKEITPLNRLGGVRILEQSQKSWYMKNDLTYFIIADPNSDTYACKHRRAAQKWVENINMAIKFSNELQKNPSLVSQIRANQIEIKDIDEEQQPIKVKKNTFTFSTDSMKEIRDSNPGHKRHETTLNGKDAIKSSPQIQQFETHKQSESSSSLTKEQRVELKKEQVQTAKTELTKEINSITTSKVSFSSFNLSRILGQGSFGKVFLAKHIQSGNMYALKALMKKKLINKKQLKYAIIEAKILQQANNPFIVNLHYAFQTPNYLYLALDYCSGKDLSFHIANEVTFSEQDARFYIAELVLAIQHLHSKNIIYRDLKPQNILLTNTGHIKLADFGLSKQTTDERTQSFCGSPAYLSPEMVNKSGAGKQSDIYGIGAVLYQFLVGEPPYFAEDIITLYRNIKEAKLKFPKNISQNAKNLLVGLLQRDPRKRLGSKGFSQIKKHPFFSFIDWEKLYKMELPAPQRVSIDDSEDSDNQMQAYVKKTNFTDFDYDESSVKVNRLLNFSFSRKD